MEERDSAAKEEKKVHLSVLPAIGYTIQTGFTVDIISNNVFLLGDKSNTNLSSVTFQIEFSQRKQLSMPFNIVIWTPENKWNFVSDWRYYVYHQLNYGLGGSTVKENEILINYNYLRIHQTAYRKVAKYSYLGAGYKLDHHTNIEQNHIDENPINDFSTFGDSSTTTSSGFTLNALFDKRKNSISPKKGEHYANVIYRHNSESMGGTSNWASLFIDLRTYFKPSSKSENILAFWSYNQFVLSGMPPFFDLPSTGWDAYTNFARQYRQGRYVGKSLLYLESEYRFRISKNGFFNGSVFANGHSVSEWETNTFKQFIPGIGCSIRLKMNTESDLNLLVSYGIAADGSQGFFFNLGEAF
ncbi:MAG: outer membrane protein assembly factor BamA [Glaciecola sp.]|jgi:outer membrane protein assembly factor BamA